MASSGGFDPKQPWFIILMVLLFLLLLVVARVVMLKRRGTLSLRAFLGKKEKDAAAPLTTVDES